MLSVCVSVSVCVCVCVSLCVSLSVCVYVCIARVGLMHIGVFILLLLSGERNFGVRLNKPYSVRVPMDIPVFTGSHADFLIIVSFSYTGCVNKNCSFSHNYPCLKKMLTV